MDHLDSNIEELVNLLSDNDLFVVKQSIQTAANIIQDTRYNEMAIKNKLLIQTLVNLALDIDDIEIVKSIATIFHGLSKCRTGQFVMFENGYLSVIYKCLYSKIESLAFYSIATLHNLVIGLEVAKNDVRQNGIHLLMDLLSSNNTRFLAVVINCLRLVSIYNQSAKDQILEYGGPAHLLRILQTYDYEKLLWSTIRLLKVLSSCPKQKPIIIELGGTEILTKFLDHKSLRLVMNSLWTIRNLSDQVNAHKKDAEQIIQSLVCLLESSDKSRVLCAICILGNLTCNSKMNKMFVQRYNGLAMVIEHFVNSNPKNENFVEPSLVLIRHQTTNNFSFVLDDTFKVVKESKTVETTVKYLMRSFKWTTIKAAINLIRNLSLDKAVNDEVRKNGAIYRIYRLLEGITHLLKRKCPTGQNLDDCEEDGVKMQDLIEDILYSFLVFNYDDDNCIHIIEKTEMIQILVDMIHYQTEKKVRLAACCLATYSNFPQGKCFDLIMIYFLIDLIINLFISTFLNRC